MKKSKKKEKKAYSKPELDIKKIMVIDASDVDKKYPMINRKATQAKIDEDKKIKALLDKDVYNLNQIAAMLMIPLEKVKKVNNER